MPKLTPHWHPPGCDCAPTRPYIRVSKVGTREQVISPELQLRSIEGWARNNKKRLLEPYCDINRSGRTFRKRSVEKIIKEIAAGGYNHVTLWKWSRWARNTEESAKYTKQIQDVGGWVDSATEDIDQRTAIGKLQLGIIREFDAYTSNVMQETWKGVHERRREAGLPHGGRERFGYDYIDVRDKNGQLVGKKYEIIDDEAEMLKTAYGLYVNGGKSFNHILAYFNTTGASTTLGGAWTAQGVARMMDTGFAAGLIRERSMPSDKPSNSIRDYDVWRPGSHPAIIKRSLWDAYKLKRFTQPILPPRSRRAVHGLSALLFCAICRRRLVTKYAGAGRTHQWQCPWQKSFHPGTAVSVNNRLALVVVREWVRAEYGNGLPVAAYVAEESEAAASQQSEADRKAMKIKEQIQALENKIDNLVELAATAPMRAKQRYNDKIETWDQEIQDLREKLLPPPVKRTVVKDYDDLRSLDDVWEELSPEVLRDALSNLVHRVEVSARTSTSTRSSASDRVHPVGSWEEPDMDNWLASRPT